MNIDPRDVTLSTPGSTPPLEQCIFCRIVAGSSPAILVAENRGAIAFLAQNEGALSPGHTLVIPRRHCEGIVESDIPSAHDVIELARQVATAIRQTGLGTGCDILSANGPGSDQSILHWHLHVVPRTSGDGIDTWPTGTTPVVDDTHHEAGAKLAAVCATLSRPA